MTADSLLIQALVYLAAGVISVPIAKRLGLGSVLGYLIAGVIVGPFALDLVGEAGDVMAFAEFGVVILLFLIGLEVRPALLWEMRTSIFGLGLAQMVASATAVAPTRATSGAPVGRNAPVHGRYNSAPATWPFDAPPTSSTWLLDGRSTAW